MLKSRSARVLHLCRFLLLGVIVLGVGGQAFCQEAAAEKEPAKVKVEKKEFRGRLPNYYSRVVTEKQRREIYTIQKGFSQQIALLQAQLALLVEARNTKVIAVLTSEQLNEVDRLAAEAKAARERLEEAKETAEEEETAAEETAEAPSE